jgi:hypothetical protein
LFLMVKRKLISMKKLLIVAIIFIGVFTACSKSNSTPAVSHPIIGLWIGTYAVTNPIQISNLYYSFDIHADSSILVSGLGADGNTYYSVGKWSLTDSAFSATYTTLNLDQAGQVQTATATYNSTTGILSSGAITSPLAPTPATFTLDRVN